MKRDHDVGGIFGWLSVVFVCIMMTLMFMSVKNKIGHLALGSAGHTCFANHTCREDLTCHHGFGDEVGVCLGK